MFIENLSDGQRVADNVFLCKKITSAVTKAGKDYFNVELCDKTGKIDGKIWDPSDVGIEEVNNLDYVVCSGEILMYNGTLQFKIYKIRKAEAGTFNEADFIPKSRYNIDDMYNKLLKLIDTIKAPYMKKLLYSFFVEDKEFAEKFKKHSAAKSVHHGFSGGLLEHSLSVATLCDYYSRHYGKLLDRDLLITAAICHDMGKVKELSDFPENLYTDDGQLFGHIVMGAEMLRDRIKTIDDFPKEKGKELIHCILAHHGKFEYGSPKLPSIIEALVLHFADNLDAKVESFREVMEGNIPDAEGWYGFNRLFETSLKKTSPEEF